MTNGDSNNPAILAALNKILELELSGVIRYTHYSFMVYGFGRIPIVSWLRSQASESQLHAHEAGELITQLGGEPSLKIGPLLNQHTRSTGVILQESLKHEDDALKSYEELLEVVKGRSIMLEEYATRMISEETRHAGDVRKMLQRPDD